MTITQVLDALDGHNLVTIPKHIRSELHEFLDELHVEWRNAVEAAAIDIWVSIQCHNGIPTMVLKPYASTNYWIHT